MISFICIILDVELRLTRKKETSLENLASNQKKDGANLPQKVLKAIVEFGCGI